MTDEQFATVVTLLTDVRDELRLLRKMDVRSEAINALMVLHGRDAASLYGEDLAYARAQFKAVLDGNKPSTPDPVEAVAQAVAAEIGRGPARRFAGGRGRVPED